MEYKKALNKAALLCAQQERCKSEIAKKLEGWDVDEDQTQEILDFLVQEKYIDEQRFAEYYTRDKFRFNKWGKIKISYQLKTKDIPYPYISNALEQITQVDYNTCIEELLDQKNSQLKSKDKWKTKASLLRFMQSRGFEADLIYPKLDALMGEIETDDI